MSQRVSSKKKRGDNKKAALYGAGGTSLLYYGRDPLVGQKTLFHGTTKKAWQNIKNEGLLASKGSGGHGMTQVIGAPEHVINRTKGQVYASGTRFVANMSNDFIKNTFRQQPKTIKLRIPFRRYASYKIDPEFLEIKENVKIMAPKASKVIPTSFYKHLASYTNKDIEPKYIKGTKAWRHGYVSRAKELAREFPSYAKGNPRRLASGAVATAAGAYLVNKSVKEAFKARKKKK